MNIQFFKKHELIDYTIKIIKDKAKIEVTPEQLLNKIADKSLNKKLKTNLKKDIFKEIINYELFSINISSFNYVENQLLVGEIVFYKNGNVAGILSTNSAYSVRDALKHPTYNFKSNIFDKNLDNIPCFDKVYKYAIENKLTDIIIEFAYFDIPVGINNENIVIYEIRTGY